jgi:hypothetical protein
VIILPRRNNNCAAAGRGTLGKPTGHAAIRARMSQISRRTACPIRTIPCVAPSRLAARRRSRRGSLASSWLTRPWLTPPSRCRVHNRWHDALQVPATEGFWPFPPCPDYRRTITPEMMGLRHALPTRSPPHRR